MAALSRLLKSIINSKIIWRLNNCKSRHYWRKGRRQRQKLQVSRAVVLQVNWRVHFLRLGGINNFISILISSHHLIYQKKTVLPKPKKEIRHKFNICTTRWAVHSKRRSKSVMIPIWIRSSCRRRARLLPGSSRRVWRYWCSRMARSWIWRRRTGRRSRRRSQLRWAGRRSRYSSRICKKVQIDKKVRIEFKIQNQYRIRRVSCQSSPRIAAAKRCRRISLQLCNNKREMPPTQPLGYGKLPSTLSKGTWAAITWDKLIKIKRK